MSASNFSCLHFSGGSDKMPQTGCLINNRNVFLTVLEPGSLRSGCPHGLAMALFQEANFLCPHVVEKARELSRGSFIRALISFMRSPPSSSTMCVHLVVSDSLQPHGLQPTGLLCPRNFAGKNTGVGCHSLLQRIFLTQGLNPSLSCPLHGQVDSLPLSPSGKPIT